MQRKILRTRWTRLQTIIKIIYELRFLKINDPTNWKNSKTIHASHLSFLFPFSITIIVTTFSPFLPIPQILATLSSFKRNILIFPSVLEFDKEKKTSLNFVLEGKLIRSCTQGGGGERERESSRKPRCVSGWRCMWIGVCGLVGFSRMGTRWPIQQWSIPVHVGKHSTAFGENWISNGWMVTERTAYYWLFPSWLFLRRPWSIARTLNRRAGSYLNKKKKKSQNS